MKKKRMKRMNALTNYTQLVKVFGPRLAEQRKKMGWTQMELARRLVVNQVTVAGWETGGHIPSRINIDRICKLFNINRYDIEKTS